MKFLITPAFLFLILFSYAQSVSPTTLNYTSPSAGTQTFNIVCAATSTWFVSAPAWISIDQVNGTGPATIIVTVQDNPSVDQSRSDDIYVMIQLTSITVDKYVAITQAASTSTTPIPDLTLSTNLINVSEGSTTFTLTSDNSWTASMNAWLGLTLASTGDITSGNAGTTNLIVIADPNPTTSSRIGTITFTSGTVSKSLTVTQDGATSTPVLTLSTNSINISSGSTAFTFTSDNSWTASMDTWLGLTLANQGNFRTTGTGDITTGNAGITNLIVVADPNPTTSSRTGTITFTSGSVSISLAVIQDGAALTTDILGGASNDANNFIVYPNPSDGIVHFKYSNKVNIAIYNNNGIILYSFNADEKNTVELNPGLYFIVTEQNGLRETQKLVVK